MSSSVKYRSSLAIISGTKSDSSTFWSSATYAKNSDLYFFNNSSPASPRAMSFKSSIKVDVAKLNIASVIESFTLTCIIGRIEENAVITFSLRASSRLSCPFCSITSSTRPMNSLDSMFTTSVVSSYLRRIASFIASKTHSVVSFALLRSLLIF